jgi:hypothetical protein
MSTEKQAIIEADRKNYPKCGYSTSISTFTSNKDGDYVTETIERIQRLCPNENPVEIFSERRNNAMPKESVKRNDGFFDVSKYFKGFFGNQNRNDFFESSFPSEFKEFHNKLPQEFSFFKKLMDENHEDSFYSKEFDDMKKIHESMKKIGRIDGPVEKV